MLLRVVSLFVLSGFCAHAHAAQSFQGITCQSDIPKALLGRTMPNERVVLTEARYKSIGLHDLGGFGVEAEGDPWFLISWQICGREYVLLERHDVVRDVLVAPQSASHIQSSIVSCTVDGVEQKETAVLFIPPEDLKGPTKVDGAWFIDDQAVRFKERRGRNIVCRT